MVRWMDRWAARAQRKFDERGARWQERQRERARTGHMTAMDRWAARAQRRFDDRGARWQALLPLRPQVPSRPVQGPGGSTAMIRVDLAGFWWLRWWRKPAPPSGGAGALLLVPLLIALAIWWLVFRRAYTVHVRTNDDPPVKIHVRLPSEVAAYRAAVQLVSRFQETGPAAVPGWLAELSASSY